MAKKAVATFAAKAGAKSMVKCIRMEKSPKTGAYVFTEQLVEESKAKEFFEKKYIFDTLYLSRFPHRGPVFFLAENAYICGLWQSVSFRGPQER